MTRGVLVSHDLSDRLFKSIERAVKAVGHRQLLSQSSKYAQMAAAGARVSKGGVMSGVAF